MECEKKEKRIKRILDILLLLCGPALAIGYIRNIGRYPWMPVLLMIILFSTLLALFDLVFSSRRVESAFRPMEPEVYPCPGIQRLVLLDEQEKPIKSWDMQGRTALIIGKAGQDQELDVDLTECEFSSFIDFQHAVLNFCLDQWYVEDLDSQNGVKVRKVEDGECYRVIRRPCRVVAGDVLYIANTKLLLT